MPDEPFYQPIKIHGLEGCKDCGIYHCSLCGCCSHHFRDYAVEALFPDLFPDEQVESD